MKNEWTEVLVFLGLQNLVNLPKELDGCLIIRVLGRESPMHLQILRANGEIEFHRLFISINVFLTVGKTYVDYYLL